MLVGQIVIIVSVVLLMALGIRARFAVRTPNSYIRKQFLIWAPVAVLVLVYVVADAMSAHHNWFGSGAMVFMFAASTYSLIANLRIASRHDSKREESQTLAPPPLQASGSDAEET